MASRQYVIYGLQVLRLPGLRGILSQSLIGDWGRYFLLCVATGGYLDGDVLISIFFSEPRLLPWSSAILDSNLSVESTKEGR